MDKISRSFEEYITTHVTQLSLTSVVINLVITALLSLILGLVYERYGHSLSNRRMFARTFMVIAMTTMLIITIVKSSLALSLGLVGALSIIRFRTAIKEPEELAYLFINIAIGLGLGADQALITTASFAIIVAVVIIKSRLSKKEENQNLLLSLTISSPASNELDRIIEVLKKHCDEVSLRRFDESNSLLEAVFAVEFARYEKMQAAKSELQSINRSIKISFLGYNHMQ